MAIVPKKILEKLAFFEARLAVWTAQALNIGSSAAAVADFVTKTEDARAAVDAQKLAEDAAKAATLNARIKLEAMSVAGSAIISQVRAKALIAGPGIFVLANLPEPATPSPIGPPGTPYQFKVALNPADGTLTLTWKNDNPANAAGTIYQVYRRLGTGGGGGGGEFTSIGASGKKEFIDPTVPAGTASVAYRIQAVRSTQLGAPAEFTVNFGVGGGGEMTASVVGSPKLAA